jgi:hypothetical protein
MHDRSRRKPSTHCKTFMYRIDTADQRQSSILAQSARSFPNPHSLQASFVSNFTSGLSNSVEKSVPNAPRPVWLEQRSQVERREWPHARAPVMRLKYKVKGVDGEFS